MENLPIDKQIMFFFQNILIKKIMTRLNFNLYGDNLVMSRKGLARGNLIWFAVRQNGRNNMQAKNLSGVWKLKAVDVVKNNYGIKNILSTATKSLCVICIVMMIGLYISAPYIPMIYGLTTPEVITASIRATRILCISRGCLLKESALLTS